MRYEFHPEAELELYEAASRYESEARRNMKAPSGAMRLRLIAPYAPVDNLSHFFNLLIHKGCSDSLNQIARQMVYILRWA